MQPTDDSVLLRQYAENHSDEAFAKLVTRHINLVYSIAVRCVGDPHQAEEVAQAVFILLAKKAAQLRHDKALSSWLFQSTRLTASNFVRSETRRRRREQEAYMQSVLNDSESDVWPRIAPFLDDAVARLSAKDRQAIILRFYEGRTLREVGTALGASEDAAEKRVNRAVEKLRKFFAQRGVPVGASGLGVVISANAVQAAPMGLAGTISTLATLTGTAVTTTTTATTVKTIAMTTPQKALIAAALTAAVGTGIYEAREASQLRDQVQTLQQRQVPLTAQLTQLRTANQRLSNQLVQASDAQDLSKARFNELLRLRGKSGVAQADAIELAKLKSTLADQAGKTPDFLSNAMAVGMGMAGKIKTKNEQAKLERMKKALNLTEDQARGIRDIMQKHIERQTEMAVEAVTGKMTPEQRQAMVAEGSNQDDEIKALLTPEQLAAYSEYQQGEKAAVADKSAHSEASQIADDFSLSQEQQEQIHAALYQMNLNESTEGLNKEAIAAAKKSGNLAEVISKTMELSKSQLEEKLKILASLLTPPQINTYREEQMKKINMLAAAMKMLLPQNPAGTAN